MCIRDSANLVNNCIDLSRTRNIVIVSLTLTVGIGGAAFSLSLIHILELYDAIAKSNINVGGDVITKSSQAYVCLLYTSSWNIHRFYRRI